VFGLFANSIILDEWGVLPPLSFTLYFCRTVFEKSPLYFSYNFVGQKSSGAKNTLGEKIPLYTYTPSDG